MKYLESDFAQFSREAVDREEKLSIRQTTSETLGGLEGFRAEALLAELASRLAQSPHGNYKDALKSLSVQKGSETVPVAHEDDGLREEATGPASVGVPALNAEPR
jgi:hypothetical protein